MYLVDNKILSDDKNFNENKERNSYCIQELL